MIFYVIPVLLMGILLYKLRRKEYIDIPGPKPWPIFGNIFQINLERPHETMDSWHKKYNGLFKMYRLNTPVIVVGSYEAMREVLITRGKDFAGRPFFHRIKMSCNFNSWQDGIGFAPPDATWKLLRMTFQKHVKQFDGGLKRLEEVGNEISQDLMTCFASQDGNPFDPRADIMNNVMNHMAVFFLGKKFSREDVLFKMIYEIERETMELFSITGPHAIIDLFPWLKYLGNQSHKRFQVIIQKRDRLFLQMKKEIMNRRGNEDSAKTLLQAFLDLSTEGKIYGGEMRVKCAAANIIFAATSTSAGTFYAFLNIITHFRKVYTELQREVDNVLGGRPPRLDDRDSMPYMRATMFELLRYTTILPFSVPHLAVEDTLINGSKIPKGTEVIINNWSAHHDEKVWPEPFEFKPERFLDDSGRVLSPDHDIRKHMMAFGAGPRVCLGEVFAMSRLFLLMSTVIQRFDVQQREPKVSCDPRDYQLGLVLAAQDFKVQMTPRRLIDTQ